MGQRHQIYIVTTNDSKTYTALGAYHHQWCYGLSAPANLIRAAEMIRFNKFRLGTGTSWSEFTMNDSRELSTVAKATYGVSTDGTVSMLHDESEYLIKHDNILPSLGDNNDGCSLIVIDNNKQEVRIGLFMPMPLKNKILTPLQYVSRYYSAEKLSALADADMKVKLAIVKGCTFSNITQAELKVILKADRKLRGAK